MVVGALTPYLAQSTSAIVKLRLATIVVPLTNLRSALASLALTQRPEESLPLMSVSKARYFASPSETTRRMSFCAPSGIWMYLSFQPATSMW